MQHEMDEAQTARSEAHSEMGMKEHQTYGEISFADYLLQHGLGEEPHEMVGDGADSAAGGSAEGAVQEKIRRNIAGFDHRQKQEKKNQKGWGG